MYFSYDPTRPVGIEQYGAEVEVSVSDGVFSSQPAFSLVRVEVVNEPPSVLLDGEVSRAVGGREGGREEGREGGREGGRGEGREGGRRMMVFA